MEAALASAPPEAGGALLIDRDALAANWAELARKAAPAETGAVVKADGYGLGVGHVAPVLWRAGCRTYFVALAAEGVALRRLLPDARIFVLAGAMPGTAATFSCSSSFAQNSVDFRPVFAMFGKR